MGSQGGLPTAVGGWLERSLWEEGWPVLEGDCWAPRDWAEDWPAWEVPGQWGAEHQDHFTVEHRLRDEVSLVYWGASSPWKTARRLALAGCLKTNMAACEP